MAGFKDGIYKLYTNNPHYILLTGNLARNKLTNQIFLSFSCDV